MTSNQTVVAAVSKQKAGETRPLLFPPRESHGSLRACPEKVFGVPALDGPGEQSTLKRGHQTAEIARRRISVHALSQAAKARLLSRRGAPLLIADWDRALMMHFEVDADRLQSAVPFQLDLWRGTRAFVSVVAFTMRGMRLHAGGRLGAWLLKPISTHAFLNVRTYVRHGGESGIHFLAEWLPNRVAVLLGPGTFGLPYRLGRLEYDHRHESGIVQGTVEDRRNGSLLDYTVRIDEDACFIPCHAGSLDEWLMERYTAFNAAQGRRRFFRVWHEPWPQAKAEAHVEDCSLLTESWPFFHDAQLAGANYSPGVCNVWMGRPHCLEEN